MEDGAESDASGDTVDLDSQKLDSLELDSQEPQSPESFLPDHIQLSNAAFASSGDLHKLLAKHNIDIDSRDPAGYTTLMTMITHKRRDCALVLLKHGAGVLLVNSQGWSAFHLAASTGDIEVLQALVAAARRASDTALAEALVSLLVDIRAAPACPPCGRCLTGRPCLASQEGDSARFGHSSNRRRARARARRLRGSRRTRRARPTSSSSPLPPTLRRPEAPRPRPLPLPTPTLRPQRSPPPPPPRRHSRRSRRSRSRRRPRRQLRGRRRRPRRRHRLRAALTQSRSRRHRRRRLRPRRRVSGRRAGLGPAPSAAAPCSPSCWPSPSTPHSPASLRSRLLQGRPRPACAPGAGTPSAAPPAAGRACTCPCCKACARPCEQSAPRCKACATVRARARNAASAVSLGQRTLLSCSRLENAQRALSTACTICTL